MKSFSHIILSILLLIATTGLSYSKHYCGNELKSVSIYSEAKSCCDGPCNCCHNESGTIKVTDNFSLTSSLFDFSQDVIDSPVLHYLVHEEILAASEIFTIENNLPPPPLQTILSSLQTYRL
jgi:hypothetical protein